jgi:hypothetical protein
VQYLIHLNFQYVAQKILDINEWGTYKINPVPTDKEKCLTQDDEIFHRARLVNCGLFMQIILGDYVGAILGLVKDGLPWRLNPLEVSNKPNLHFIDSHQHASYSGTRPFEHSTTNSFLKDKGTQFH